MKKLVFTSLLLATFASWCVRRADAQAVSDVPYADCAPVAQTLFADLTSNTLTPEQAYASFVEVDKHITCFASVTPSIARTNLLKALAESFGNSMQQSSPAGSSGATSSVSKPSGSTSLIQDVGGVSATSNGSSLTLQFAPGDLVENLASDGVFDFCTSAIQTRGCKSKAWLKVFAPATFSVTANTTSPGSPVTGTASTSGTAVPATLKSASDTLSFGGISVKYGLLYKKTSDGTAQTPANVSNTASKVASSLGGLHSELASCTAYGRWVSDVKDSAIKAMQSAQSTKSPTVLLSLLPNSYAQLRTKMAEDPSCNALFSKIQNVLNIVSAYQAAIAAQQVLATSSKPMLGLEYDFTTPSNKPSYHSAKLNFSWQSTVSCVTQVQTAATKALGVSRPKSTLQGEDAATCTSAKNGTATTTHSSTSTSATPSWTISASGGADIYSDEPSSTIPSASHLRDVQAGAELTRVWHISTYKSQNAVLKDLLSKMGDLSLVGAYYYQDQTSPSILNGPPTSITFNGLPTTASQVFATRGPINVGQIRLGFGTGTNVRFPIAVSYSNRSDLIVHPFVGVQFGVSYDLFGK
jgi:hypothetical protein